MFRADPRRPTLSPNSRLKLRRYEASVIHDQRFGASTKLRTLVYAYTTNRLWRRQDYTRSPVPGEYYERIVGDVALPRGAIYFKDSNTILDREYEVLGVEPRLEQRFTTGDVGHTLDVGARLLVETAHYELRKGEVPTSEAGSLELDERHRTIAIATYTQDRIAFRDDLLVTPGIRFESASYRRQLFRQSGQDVAPPARGDSSVASFVPGVGMIYGTRQAHVFGGIHLGFAPPRVTSAINPNGVDQKLDAERAILYELGTRASPVRWLRAEVTGFLSSFQNQVVAAQSDIGTELTNAGATRNVGVESGVTLQLARAAKLPLTVDLGARYTYVRATFVGGPNDGNLLPYAPEHSGGATLDVEHASGFGGQLGVVVVGAQYTDPLDTEAEDATGRVGKIPAYTIVDAGLRYRNAPTGLSARILVKNALDDVYLSSRRPEGIFASGFRQIILGIRWDYGRGP
jgi:Fe(3+) dicitrate transport protein